MKMFLRYWLLLLVLVTLVSTKQSIKLPKLNKSRLDVSNLLEVGIETYEPIPKEDIKEDYMERRKHLMFRDRATHFTVDVGKLTPEEKELEQRLFGIRETMIAGEKSPLLMEVHDAIDVMKTSPLFEVLKDMPKGAHLHYHIEAGITIDDYLEFTKNDDVYYSFSDDKIIHHKYIIIVSIR